MQVQGSDEVVDGKDYCGNTGLKLELFSIEEEFLWNNREW